MLQKKKIFEQKSLNCITNQVQNQIIWKINLMMHAVMQKVKIHCKIEEKLRKDKSSRENREKISWK